MKICSNCSASNTDAARFCSECGTALVTIGATPEAASGAAKSFDAGSLAKSLSVKAETIQAKRKADIVFVLDCTGSMGGEINAIRDAINSFVQTIASDGVRARVGLVEFRDRLIHEDHRVLMFSGQPFTSDPEVFREETSKLRATGGGDAPESSLDAIILALRQPFALDANKVLVLVTDAPPHIPDQDTKSVEEVQQALTETGINQLYLVIRVQDPKSQVYLKLLEGRRGNAFDLGKGDDFRSRADDFKKTLMSLGKTISAATR